jgi:riboflavin synthase
LFTGIVEERGEIADIVPAAGAEPARDGGPPSAVRLTVKGPLVAAETRSGDSIAVNGVCLTVVDPDPSGFSADVMRETLDRSSLGALRPGSAVNLERAARVGDRLGGHIVQGHVDGTARIRHRAPEPGAEVVTVELPQRLAHYVVEKGSITLDGVSLTVASLGEGDFTVSLIPSTLDLTTLGTKAVGESVNVEVDVLAKYVERMMTANTAEEARR